MRFIWSIIQFTSFGQKQQAGSLGCGSTNLITDPGADILTQFCVPEWRLFSINLAKNNIKRAAKSLDNRTDLNQIIIKQEEKSRRRKYGVFLLATAGV